MGICFSTPPGYNVRLETFAKNDTQAVADDDDAHARSGSIPSVTTEPPSPHAPSEETMLEAVLDQRRFESAEDIRRYVASIRGKPGETPDPTRALVMPPGPLKRVVDRRIAKLETTQENE